MFSASWEPWADFWYNPASHGYGTKSGQNVSAMRAMQCTAVFACVRMLAEDMGKLPLNVYEVSKTDPRVKNKVVDHDLYQILHSEPNPNQTAFEWTEMGMGHTALRGRAYSFIEIDFAGKIIALWPLHPDRVITKLRDDGSIYYEFRDKNSKLEVFPAEKILHFKGLSDDGLEGMGPLQLARETFGATLAADEYSHLFFKNDARPPGILSTDQKLGGGNAEKAKTEREQIKNDWAAATTGENKHKLPVTDQGLKWTTIGIAPEDAQLLETRNFNVSDIARIFRVPQHKIGQLEKATFSNIEQQALEYVQDAILPWAVRREQAINRRLFNPEDKGRYYVKYNLAALLRGDLLSRYTAFGMGRNAGFLSANDCREMEDMNPIPNGDFYLQPVNYIEAGKEPPAPAPVTVKPTNNSAFPELVGHRNGNSHARS